MRRYCFVATAYVVRDGKTLLLKHKKLGLWLPPGGHIDDGETPDQAALREVREETGLAADFVVPTRGPDPADGRVEFLHPPQHVQVEEIPGHNHHIDFIYYLRARPGAVRPGDGESAEWRWHGPEDLDGGHLSEEVRATARLAIALVAR
ncbi:MAG: NUDIX domain-containing protein [Elusimicrobia bacterium]|nr:NUDIX domain-containing protein [Elusimicrobiota bacterium]